jgi:hypothetical protein
MSFLGRAAVAKPVEQPTPDRCNACGHTEDLAALILDAVHVKACRDFRACCDRARRSGMWLL